MPTIGRTLLLSTLLLGLSSAAKPAEQARFDDLFPSIAEGSEHVQVGLQFDPQVCAALPPGIVAADGCTGGLNIYAAAGGFPKAAENAYLWVDLKGLTSGGLAGRWVLAVITNNRSYWDSFTDVARVEGTVATSTDDGAFTATATGAGDRIVASLPDSAVDEATCARNPGTLLYQSTLDGMITQFAASFAVTFCLADVAALKLDMALSAGSPFAPFKPTAVLWAARLKDGTIAVQPPVLVRPVE